MSPADWIWPILIGAMILAASAWYGMEQVMKFINRRREKNRKRKRGDV